MREKRKGQSLLKGNYVIANSTPNGYLKRAPAFNKMDRYSSINSNAHSFTNIKCNFYPILSLDLMTPIIITMIQMLILMKMKNGSKEEMDETSYL